MEGRTGTDSRIDILFVGYGDWHLWSRDGFRTRSAQLCRFLAGLPFVRRLIVLNEPVYLTRVNPGFALSALQRFATLPARARCRQAEQKIFLLDPSRFLVGRERVKRPYVQRMVRRRIPTRKERLVLWIANVHKAYLMEAVPARLRVFDAIDDWEAVTGYQKYRRLILEGYETVFRRADLIYTVSKHLERRFRDRAVTPHVYHLPNGVDTDLFHDPAPPPGERGHGRRTNRPVLTYVGVLAERFDVELVERLASERPEYTIRLVGPMSRQVAARWKDTRRPPNIEWTGLVHHGRIPAFLRSSDVLLIPHRVTPLSRSMDPLKLYEYLTTGLPIVATPVPPVPDFHRLVYIGSGASFSGKVEEALAEADQPDARDLWRARIEESKKHSWRVRTERVARDIQRLLGQCP